MAPWRIAVASGVAFIVSQGLDIAVFNRWRQSSWWKAPFVGSLVASVVGTAIFFFIAFAGTDLDWRTLAAGDLGVKLLMAVVLLAPYRAMLPRLVVVTRRPLINTRRCILCKVKDPGADKQVAGDLSEWLRHGNPFEHPPGRDAIWSTRDTMSGRQPTERDRRVYLVTGMD